MDFMWYIYNIIYYLVILWVWIEWIWDYGDDIYCIIISI